KGIGTGNGVGIGQSGWSGKSDGTAETQAELGVSSETAKGTAPESLRVVIKDRNYYLRSGGSETPIDLDALVSMVQSAIGDDDGIKLRIYRTESARVTAELQLRESLKTVDVADSAIYTSPDVVE
ncbi:MAG: hypothetical protein B7Z55_15240, partial [Planctomycetales bacterium 12-60-4]